MKRYQMKSTARAFLPVLLVFAALPAGLAIQGCKNKKDTRAFRKGPVDLTKWTAINYRFPRSRQPYANWVLSDDKQSVTQTANADPSIFLSDRDLEHTSISGNWLVDATSDDDFVGFVFAYQNPGKFYIFDWKGGAQRDTPAGMAEQGMCVKVAEADYDGPSTGNLQALRPFDQMDLWHTKGVKGKVRLLGHEPTEPWQYGTPYRFQLDFRPGRFRIEVKDAERVIYDKTFTDNTYRTGRFGFYNYSQGGVVYRGFRATEIPQEREYGWIIIIVVLLAVVLVTIIVTIKRPRRPSRTRK